MTVHELELLLARAIGLDAASIGVQAVARASEERQRACGLPDLPAYLAHVTRDPHELQQLIEAVVVPETWFFRDREAFHALVRALGQVGARTPNEPLRMLSIPCATGEEPYSLAIMLLDAGFAPERFMIDAVDVSERALAQARRGWYGKNSFRGAELTFRDRYFEPMGAGYQISPSVQRRVQFRRENLLADDLLSTAAPYHVIFCRNVLIYFGVEAQQRALQALRRLLREEGLLFVGPSEAGLLARAGFASLRVRLAFAFRKAATAPPPPAAVPRAPRRAASNKPLRTSSAALAPRPAGTAAVRSSAAAGEALLDAAVRLADAGQLEDAAATCAEHMRRAGPSARALHLLGLLSEATGRVAEAAAYHKKALYLDPQHHEALLHLALLLDRQGDAEAARLLRTRARRLASKG